MAEPIMGFTGIVGVDLARADGAVRIPALVVTPEASELIGDLLDIAYDDQSHYLQFADPQTDYGDEWPEVAKTKAARFCGFARLAVAVGLYGEPERWYDLAKDVADWLPADPAIRCECGRWPHDCATFDDPKADHGDRE